MAKLRLNSSKLRLGFLIIISLFISLSISRAYASLALDNTGGGGGGSLPNDIKVLDNSNDQRNINNAVNFNSTISNPTQVLQKQGSNTQLTVGGDGALESIFAGFVKNLDITPSRLTTITDANGNKSTYVVSSPGALGSVINLTAQVFAHPPASSVDYIADVFDSVSHPFAQKAYAQGIGFSSLAPVLNLWKLFRNLAYGFFVVIFVAVGFLIMIRSKIGSQTAVTVQQMLPKLIIALILVTFSYAIAGLMIDVMYLSIFILINLFGGINTGTLTPDSLTKIAFTNDIFTSGIGLITNGVANSISGSMGSIVNTILTNLGWSSVTAGAVSISAGVVFMLVLIVAILVSLFRVFFALITAYLGIFFSIITAPIVLLIGALPGQNTFGKWIKGLMENLIVFPAIIFLIFIAYYFTQGQPVNYNATNSGFVAPQLGSNQGGGGFAVYQSIIALGAILAMPEIIKISKGLMKGQIDVSGKDLVKGMAGGNQLAAPLLGIGAGAGLGAAVGGFYGARGVKGGLGARIGGAYRGVIGGAKDSSGKARGGAFRVGRQGYKQGRNVSRYIDYALDGKLFDPDNLSAQLEELNKRTGKGTAPTAGAGGGSSAGGPGTPIATGGP